MSEMNTDTEILQSGLDIPYQLKPINLKIAELKEKYKNVSTKLIFHEFQQTAKKMQELNNKIREIHVLEQYNVLTENQKFLHDELDEKLQNFQNDSNKKNIVLLIFNTNNELLKNVSECEKYKYEFFESIEEASTFVDENTSEEDEGNIYIAPLFLAV